MTTQRRRIISRLATVLGVLALAALVAGVVAAIAVDPTLMIVAGVGGVLLIPALIVSRREATLAGPRSPLDSLLTAPRAVHTTKLVTWNGGQRVAEHVLDVAIERGRARYPLTHVTNPAAPLEAIRRRAGAPTYTESR